MDSRDLIIIGAVGIGAWLAWRSGLITQLFQYGLPSGAPPMAANNPSGSSSMVAGAAAQTQTGDGTTHGLIIGAPISRPSLGGTAFGSSNFQSAAGSLLWLNVLPQPVASVPVKVSSPTAGVAPTGGTQPPPQRLTPTINPLPASWRGLV